MEPRDAITDGTRLFVADVQNHRILIWNSLSTASTSDPDVVLGQPGLTTRVPTYGGLDERTFSFPQGLCVGGGRIFVSDSSQRVLVWNSIPDTHFKPADLVLGQMNFKSKDRNAGGISLRSMAEPQGISCSNGKLLVADTGNNRVLVWNSYPTQNGQPADLILGQASETTSAAAVSATGLSSPVGVGTDGVRVAVADRNSNRIMIWSTFPAATGQAANIVLGQANFTTGADQAAAANTLNTPQGVWFGTTSLYVADTYNSRILRFGLAGLATGASANLVLG